MLSDNKAHDLCGGQFFISPLRRGNEGALSETPEAVTNTMEVARELQFGD